MDFARRAEIHNTNLAQLTCSLRRDFPFHGIRLWFEHVTVILPIARAIEAAATSDPDARAAWQERMDANRRVSPDQREQQAPAQSGWKARTVVSFIGHPGHRCSRGQFQPPAGSARS